MRSSLWLTLLGLPLLVGACSTVASGTPESIARSEADVDVDADTDSDTDGATRAWLRDFGATYRYDVGYLEMLVDLSPAAYKAFAAGMGMSDLQGQLPLDAHHVGVISALLADDCGQCTQLNLRVAAESGVDRDVLRQILEDPEELPATLRLVHDYATQVVHGENADPDTVAALRETFGDEGFAELAVNVIGARIYPALRRAMGAETVCPPPTLDF